MDIKISIIVPYYEKDSRKRSFLSFVRFVDLILPDYKNIELVLVTDAKDVESLFSTRLTNLKIVQIEKMKSKFSLAKFRNKGVLVASGKWIFLFDMDLRISRNNLDVLLGYLKYFEYENSFIIFPVAYEEKGSSRESFEFDVIVKSL